MAIRSMMPWSRGERRPALTEYDDPFEALHRNMDRLFDTFRHDFDFPSLRTRNGPGIPFVDVSETPAAVTVDVELPGMDATNVELTFHADSLVIKGEKTEEKETKEKDYHVRERSFGSFHRVIPLPPGLEEEKAKAEYDKGVLHVTIPKSLEAKGRRKKIDIKTR